MISLQREPFADFMEELKPLLQQHYHEVAHYQDIALNPDYDFYCKSPALRHTTVREAGRLVGYAIFGVGRNKHYQDSLQAVQDVLFVDPRDRGGLGRTLVRECDRQLKGEGVQVVYHHQKLAHPALGELLRSEGYEPVEVIWAKRLDKE